MIKRKKKNKNTRAKQKRPHMNWLCLVLGGRLRSRCFMYSSLYYQHWSEFTTQRHQRVLFSWASACTLVRHLRHISTAARKMNDVEKLLERFLHIAIKKWINCINLDRCQHEVHRLKSWSALERFTGLILISFISTVWYI